MVTSAAAAQREYRDWPEARVDTLLADIAETIADAAPSLAEEAVAETRMGRVEDKIVKIRFASMDVFQSVVGRPAAGLLSFDANTGVAEYAHPVGVVFGLIPATNSVSTLVFKTLIALKGRNALVVRCHRSSVGVGARTGRLIRSVLIRHGAPSDLLRWVAHPAGRETTALLMRHHGVGLVLATGGASLVKAAYSSGTPAIGVGQGNAPAYVAADADPAAAASLVVASKSFDCGIVCGSEHNLVVDEACYAATVAALRAAGAAVVDVNEVERLTATLFDGRGALRPELAGRPAGEICAAAQLHRFHAPSIIVAPVPRHLVSGPWGHEKLVPVLSLFTTDGVDDALGLCARILSQQGRGHTMVVHSPDWLLAQRFAAALDVSRVLWNTGGSQGCIGLGSGLTPSLTLGCGTYGGTSTTDNITYRHLLNIKRVAGPVPSGGGT